MPEQHVDWEEVIELDPKGYMEIQDQKQRLIFHGPIDTIEVDEMDFVRITLKWVAQMGMPGEDSFGSWEKAPDEAKETVFPNIVVPFVIQNTPAKGRRICFGLNIIYIDAIEGIDPSEVRGLDLPEEKKQEEDESNPPETTDE